MTPKGAGPTMIPLSNWMLKEIGWDKKENDKNEQTSVHRFKAEMIMIDPDLLEEFSQDSTSKGVEKSVREPELSQSFNDKLGSRKELFHSPLHPKKANKRTSIVDQSPLIDMDKAEMLLKKKAFNPSNFFSKPTITKIDVKTPIKEETCSSSPCTLGTTVAKEVVKNDSMNPEFEFLERMCGVQDNYTNEKNQKNS
ncbi:hypothetical protein HHI36_012999 [Cryptolaemus montrouzieri]|uniref:Uncharacterized protein n=1 Tax=Cryptolaemus montrouzieri TaxID=559131 RepID=A0ABD2NFV1_9CUCU